MRTPSCSSQTVTSLIRKNIVVAFPEIHAALGPVSHRTVCRKLVEAGCRSSYSHRGSYYTLDECTDYDAHGVWSYGDIHFSRNGTLLDTLVVLVDASETGMFARDMKPIVKVEILVALTRLIKTRRLSRRKAGDHYLYCSMDPATRRRQVRNQTAPSPMLDETYANASKSFLGLLDEKQRRMYAGLESLRPGSGGDQRIAEQLDLSRVAVTSGRKQLLSGAFEMERIRKIGGGRKSVKKKPRTPPPDPDNGS